MTKRGTSNGNSRGSAANRRSRREWIWKHWQAVSVFAVTQQLDAVRCWRCGLPLMKNEFTIDRIVPGAHGGRYTRDNIRPACAGCNSEHGGSIREAKR